MAVFIAELGKPFAIIVFFFEMFREQEKVRRWQEIRLRQNRLRADNVTRNATLEQSMLKSGFTMSDINGNLFPCGFSYFHQHFCKTLL